MRWPSSILLCLILAVVSSLSGPRLAGAQRAVKKPTPGLSVVRWKEGNPDSSFSLTSDGKYVYGLRSGNVHIVVAFDSQELEKVHHRALPLFTLRTDITYTGQKPLELNPDDITLTFISHYQSVSAALDADQLGVRIQADIDSLNDDTRHEIRKHPEKKSELELLLQTHLKDMTDLVGFISLNALRMTELNPENQTAGGWLFFSTKSKWIGSWKAREEFIVRIPIQDQVFEFPFALPPHKGDLVLRQRPD